MGFFLTDAVGSIGKAIGKAFTKPEGIATGIGTALGFAVGGPAGAAAVGQIAAGLGIGATAIGAVTGNKKLMSTGQYLMTAGGVATVAAGTAGGVQALRQPGASGRDGVLGTFAEGFGNTLAEGRAHIGQMFDKLNPFSKGTEQASIGAAGQQQAARGVGVQPSAAPPPPGTDPSQWVPEQALTPTAQPSSTMGPGVQPNVQVSTPSWLNNYTKPILAMGLMNMAGGLISAQGQNQMYQDRLAIDQGYLDLAQQKFNQAGQSMGRTGTPPPPPMHPNARMLQ